MKPFYFSIEDSKTKSSIIMDKNNEHVETLVQGEGEVDETHEEFLIRVSKRLNYLNSYLTHGLDIR
jgi:hypothetical protein